MDGQEVKQKQAEELQKIKDAIRDISETEAGQIFFSYLMRSCYYQTSTIIGDPQSHEINTLASIYNESRRRVYLDLRRHIPPKIRQKIEN